MPIQLCDDPSLELVEKLSMLIVSYEDALIFGAVLQGHTPYFITLDRKHFFTEKLMKAKLPILILTPKEFWQSHFQE